jgi:hypothetical protein
MLYTWRRIEEEGLENRQLRTRPFPAAVTIFYRNFVDRVPLAGALGRQCLPFRDLMTNCKLTRHCRDPSR